jgi:hypothetical protein
VQRVAASALVSASVGVWLGAGAACVDSSHHASADAAVGVEPVTCQGTPPVAATNDAGIPSSTPSPTGAYAWKNVVIKGGGFVSGIVMSRAMPGLAFVRTDVGGAYRFDPASGRWAPLTDWVGKPDSNLIGIESIAVDPVDPNRVYLAAGEYTSTNGFILSSTDMGQTFTQNAIGAPMGGNADGRNLGERLAVDPNLPSTLYFGSRNTGLWTSADYGQTWTLVTHFINALDENKEMPVHNATGNGYGLTLVLFDPSTGTTGSATPTIYVGVGVTTGPTLYQSIDAGMTWAPVDGAPTGMMPHHAVLDGCGDIYFTYNNGSGPNGVTAGAIWRYTPTTAAWTDVSPAHGGFGFGGISADVAHPGTLVVTSIDDWGDSQAAIYRTTDGGANWTSLAGAAAWEVAGAQWLHWHGTGLPGRGWMGDVEIDPFDSSHAMFITGQGLWSSDDIDAADSGAATHWTFEDDGLEETVALDLASPPAGPPQSPSTPPLLSGVGDIGGFRHDDLTVSPTQGMFDNPIFGNTNSIDFAERAPSIVARVGTSSQSGGPSGAWSMDGGTTWMPFPPATSPQVSSSSGTMTYASAGSIAVSADGATFVWIPARKGAATSPSPPPSYSTNQGATWTACTGLSAGLQIAADRVNPAKFYATTRGAVYLSTDGGASFVPGALPANLTPPNMTTPPVLGRPRAVFGFEGDVWLSTSSGLLHSQDSGMTYSAVAGVNGATAVGFGAPVASGQTYPSVYLAGSVALPSVATFVWGIYRSDDAGMSWQHIDDPQHQFGSINVLAGDPRQPGRVYLGTGGRGIVYGDPLTAAATPTVTQ